MTRARTTIGTVLLRINREEISHVEGTFLMQS